MEYREREGERDLIGLERRSGSAALPTILSANTRGKLYLFVTIMLAWLQLLLWASSFLFVVSALSLGLLLWVLHVWRSQTWKYLRDVPGPNESIPLRWIVQQHSRASRERELVPYNVGKGAAPSKMSPSARFS